MNELLVSIDSKKHLISTNFDDIKAELMEKMEGYKGVVVDESTIKESKKDLADLRKMRDEIETKRKEIKKEWEVPYNQFKEKCDELTALIDKPINEINKQLTDLELKRILEKREHLIELYKENIGALEEYLPFDNVYKKQWDNVGYKDKDVIFDISEAVTKVRSDLDIIKSLNSEIEDELLDTYKKNGNNLASAITRNQQYVADKARIETQKEEAQKEAPAEKKVESEALTTLNDIVELTKTVHLIISKTDLQAAKNCLDFADIPYQVVEG